MTDHDLLHTTIPLKLHTRVPAPTKLTNGETAAATDATKGPLANMRAGHPNPDTPETTQEISENLEKYHSEDTRKYYWKKGDCLANYNASAQIWKAHTTTSDFVAAFNAVSDTYHLTNDIRAAKIEEFLLAEATKAGVIEVKTSRKTFANPNKWEKHLAPWYNM
jgi:hypothetical protein